MSTLPGNGQSAVDADRGTWKKLTNSLPTPPRAEDRDDLLWQAFEAQFGWYDKSATTNRRAYQILKLVTLIAGAAVTVLAALSAPAAVTASVAGVIVVVEGAQQMFQFHPNWLSYRSTAESLRQHALLYLADISPYDDRATRRDRLAAVMKDLTSKESANWSNTMQQTAPRTDGGTARAPL